RPRRRGPRARRPPARPCPRRPNTRVAALRPPSRAGAAAPGRRSRRRTRPRAAGPLRPGGMRCARGCRRRSLRQAAAVAPDEVDLNLAVEGRVDRVDDRVAADDAEVVKIEGPGGLVEARLLGHEADPGRPVDPTVVLAA